MKFEGTISEYRRMLDLQPIIEGVTSFFESLSKDYGFEERLGQKLLSFDITKAIITNKCLIGEAGVGIGKSFAYIVPLLFYNQQTEKPVVIATSTIALQEQVVSDIKTISDMIDYHPEIVNTKGQNHFICRKRAEQYFGKSEKPSNILLAIRDGADERKDFTMRIDNRTWNTLVSEDSDRFAIQVNSNTEGAVAQLRSSIIDFQNRIERLMSHYRVRQNKSLNFAFGELRLLVGYLWNIVEYNKESDYLLWLEKHNNQISVSECPKEIDFEANEMLFDNYTPTILVSATLANTTEQFQKSIQRFDLGCVAYEKQDR